MPAEEATAPAPVAEATTASSATASSATATGPTSAGLRRSGHGGLLDAPIGDDVMQQASSSGPSLIGCSVRLVVKFGPLASGAQGLVIGASTTPMLRAEGYWKVQFDSGEVRDIPPDMFLVITPFRVSAPKHGGL